MGGGLDLLVRHEMAERFFNSLDAGLSFVRNTGAWLRGVLWWSDE